MDCFSGKLLRCENAEFCYTMSTSDGNCEDTNQEYVSDPTVLEILHFAPILLKNCERLIVEIRYQTYDLKMITFKIVEVKSSWACATEHREGDFCAILIQLCEMTYSRKCQQHSELINAFKGRM